MEGKVSDTRQLLEKDAVNAPVKDILWEANQIQTESVKIIDPGVGKPVVLRHFFFKEMPKPKGAPSPTKLELINHYKKLIEMNLWSDGLHIREDKPIEIHTRRSVKKVSPSLFNKMCEEGADFVILCLAEAGFGQTVNDTPLRAK